ncbi:MAG: hypothetical protein WCF20_10720 [Methylovirgula sp.]
MRKPIPWGVRGSGGDVREAARDAARREGMTLSEWLAQAVGQYAARVGTDPANMNEDDRVEAIAAQLHRLGIRGARRGESQAPRAKPRLPRADNWPARSSKPHANNPGAAYAAEDALLERALARLEDRADFETLAHRIDHLEAELAEAAPQNTMQPIRGALARLEARLDSLARPAVQSPPHTRTGQGALPPHYDDQLDRVESKVNSLFTSLASSVALPESALSGRPSVTSSPIRPSLGAAIAEITRRQRALEDPGSAPPIEERPAASLRFSRNRQDRGDQQWSSAEAFGQAGGATLESLHSDIAALAGQVEDMRREQAERDALPPVACNLDKLRAEIAIMSDALRDLASRGSIAPLEAAIRNLTQQIETSRSDGIREAVLRPLERLVGDLRLALAEVDPRTTIRGLEGEVRKLGSKLDDLGKCGFDASALGMIDDRTREIRDLLAAAPANAAPVDKIERQVEALTERFDRMRDGSERRDEGDLQAVADELRLLMGDHGRASLAKIEGQLDAIAAKVEEALTEARDESRYTALANRINDVHQELTERLSQGMPQLDMHALENLMRGLAEKIEAARGPQADGRAIEALQRQVSEFAARLDRAGAGFPSLTSLEQSIGDLFAEIERTRDVSYAAAERAARSVLEEALAKTAIGPDRSDVTRDLVELRNMQDEAGRRTFATLNAVHETLEKVVDRLAMVETEIADVRIQRPAELLASGPAPNFAPARGREPVPPPFTPSKAAPAARSDRRMSKGSAPGERPKLESQADMLDDFLIEPGRGFPGRRHPAGDESGERKQGGTPSDHLDMPEAASGRAGFIAAARRAAQAAQMESAAAIGRAPSHGGAASGEGAASLIEQTRDFIVHHKRPVVLSIAALFLAMGAYAVVKTVGHSPLIDLSVNAGKEAPAARGLPARSAAAPTQSAPSSAPAATQGSAPRAQAIPGSDPIVTGAIGAKPQVAYPSAYPSAGPSAAREASPAVLQSLAQAGNAKAQYELATDYATGRELPRDLKLAAQWYEKAAAQGLPPAQYRLGSLYEKGLGVGRDLALAKSWYQKAATAGNVRAMHNLAVLTAEGGDSDKPDYAAAAQWFRKAAEYGVRDSQYNLAILLARGLGIPQNLALSYRWFAIAAAQGDEDAGKKRDDVGARLGAADLVAAKATAAAFHAKAPDPAANEVAPPQGGWSAPTSSNKARPKISRL